MSITSTNRCCDDWGAIGLSILISIFWGNEMNFMQTCWNLLLIFVVCLVLLQKLKINPILVMVLAGMFQLFIAMI